MPDNSLVLIGAGSTVFTPGLLRDVASSRAFDDYTVHLVDINGEAAEVMARVGRRIADALGSTMKVEAHVDRREAMPHARFVATTIAVGAAEGWRHDLDIPARYGIQQTVGDSVGPGGVLRALRHVPELVAIARDVAELAPDAWLVNYSNPLTANVRSIRRETDVRAVGLCHGTMHTKARLCQELGLPDVAVSATFAGLNHLCWLTDIRYGGRDLYPRVRELVQQPSDDGRARADGVHGGVSAHLMRTYGLYPAPGDRHVSEFFADFLRLQDDGDLAWGLQPGLDMTREYIGEKSTLWDELREIAAGRRELDLTPDGEAERLVDIMAAIAGGPDHLELAVNLPNAGLVPNLPSEAVVEVPAVVGTAGISGVEVGPLPSAVAEVLTVRAEQQEITVSAALGQDRTLALEALARDPLVADAGVAEQILDDAIAAHAPRLDAFRAS